MVEKKSDGEKKSDSKPRSFTNLTSPLIEIPYANNNDNDADSSDESVIEIDANHNRIRKTLQFTPS